MNTERKNKKNEKGFTMIELIIVVAIMGIIGAVLVPTFNNMSIKARLTTDITSVKTLQRQLEVYKAETGSYPTDFVSLTTSVADQTKMQTVVGELVKQKYIDSKDLKEIAAPVSPAAGKYELRLQSGGKLTATDSRLKLDISKADYKDLITNIDEANKIWVNYSGT